MRKREKVMERRDRKQEREKWKGGKVEEVKGSNWGTEGAPKSVYVLSTTLQAITTYRV